MTLRWGIAGTGRIAQDVGEVIAALPDMTVSVVGSRDQQRASAFGKQFGAAGRGSYESMVEDPSVDAVYVATPHAVHAEVVELALGAGKAVLCEKPLTHQLTETVRLVELARSSGTFLMEAMWMRFNPLVQRLYALVREGGLGTVLSVQAAFGFQPPYDETGRLWDPALGGGALLDLGIYPVQLARLLLGDPTSVQASGSLAPTGVDSAVALLLTFPGGGRALLEASLLHQPPAAAVVTGTHGFAVLGPRFHAPTSLAVTIGGERSEYSEPDSSAGFRGELLEVAACLQAGLSESQVMPLSETVATMRVLDTARAIVAAQESCDR